MSTRRILLSTGMPARALAQIDVLCRTLPANAGADCRSIQRAVKDSRYPSDFRALVLSGLDARGLIFEVSQGAYRITAEGSEMLARIKANEPARRKNTRTAATPTAAAQDTDAPVTPLVPPSRIQRLQGIYDKDECNFRHVRPGSLDFRDLPSRRGNMLVYRDGRQVPIDHALSTTTRPRPAQVDLQGVARPQPAANEQQAEPAKKVRKAPGKRAA